MSLLGVVYITKLVFLSSIKIVLVLVFYLILKEKSMRQKLQKQAYLPAF